MRGNKKRKGGARCREPGAESPFGGSRGVDASRSGEQSAPIAHTHSTDTQHTEQGEPRTPGSSERCASSRPAVPIPSRPVPPYRAAAPAAAAALPRPPPGAPRPPPPLRASPAAGPRDAPRAVVSARRGSVRCGEPSAPLIKKNNNNDNKIKSDGKKKKEEKVEKN